MGAIMETAQVNAVVGAYRRRSAERDLLDEMETRGEAFYTDTYHTIAINTRETEFGSIVEPIPITLKTYKPFLHSAPINGYGYPQSIITSTYAAPLLEPGKPPSSVCFGSPAKEVKEAPQVVRPPPKKKWIKEYLEEEPKSPVSVRVVTGVPVAARSNGVVTTSPVTVAVAPPCPSPAHPAAALEPVSAPAAPLPAPHLEFVQEHSRSRTISNSHGLPQIPSPPSVGSNGSNGSNGSSNGNSSGSGSGSNGSAPRAGTREVHNKLEKNRRAHLKECFELLKRQLPATPDDKKTSNLSILGSAIRYINVLRRKERECEHEMERLARDKIAAQQRLAGLKREVSSIRMSAATPVTTAATATAATAATAATHDAEDKEMNDSVVNHQMLGIPVSITSSPPRAASLSPPHTLNLSTKLRSLPIQITPTSSQAARAVYGTSGRHAGTVTLTTLAPADCAETSTTTTLVHPAQIHLPLSQVVVGSAALQLLSAGGLRVLHPAHSPHSPLSPLSPLAPHHVNGVTENNRIASKENGVRTPPPSCSEGGMVVGVVSPPAHLLHTHTLTHKMVETQLVKGGAAPLTVSAQYLSATTIVNPVVVVSAASPPAPPAPPS